MIYAKIAVFVVTVGMCSLLYAGDEEVKGLEIVPDTVETVVNKASALLTGNLKCTMTIDKDKYRDDYITTPQGIRVPSRTLGRYDSGVR